MSEAFKERLSEQLARYKIQAEELKSHYFRTMGAIDALALEIHQLDENALAQHEAAHGVEPSEHFPENAEADCAADCAECYAEPEPENAA